LHFKRAFVDPTVHDAIKTRAALIEERRRSKIRVACVNRRTAQQQRMGQRRPAVVLQWAK
jgi:ribosomal protein L21